MCMICWRAFRLRVRCRIERFCYCAKYKGPVYLYSFHALLGVWRCHGGMWLQKWWLTLIWISNGNKLFLASCTIGSDPCRWSVLLHDISPSSASSPRIDMPDEQKNDMAAVKKIVVCGGSGFLGSRICKSAVARGWDVTSIRCASE